jgi:hypothetical protein
VAAFAWPTASSWTTTSANTISWYDTGTASTATNYTCALVATAWPSGWATYGANYSGGGYVVQQGSQEYLRADARRGRGRFGIEAAEARADELLAELLEPAQLDEYREHGRFTVVAPSGRTYRLLRGLGVAEVNGEDGRVLRRFCIHPPRWHPAGDVLVCQKLLLETDEAEFLATANVS